MDDTKIFILKPSVVRASVHKAKHSTTSYIVNFWHQWCAPACTEPRCAEAWSVSPSCALRQFLTSARILAAKALGPVLQVIGGARTRPLLEPGERMLRAHRQQQWCQKLLQIEDTVNMLDDLLLPMLGSVEGWDVMLLASRQV